MTPCPTQREAAGGWLVHVRKRPHTSQPPAPPRSPAAPQGASRCGRAVWQEAVAALRSGHNLMPNGTAELASCYGSICAKITLSAVADNHYFREISFFAMARCSLLSSCYGSVRPCALLLPRKKRQGRGRTLQRPHPCRFFGGQQDAAHPPPKLYPLWLDARCLVPAMARCVNAPSCSPKQRKGRLVLVRKRPFTSLPFRCLGGRTLRPPCPTQRRRKGQAGARPQAAVH